MKRMSSALFPAFASLILSGFVVGGCSSGAPTYTPTPTKTPTPVNPSTATVTPTSVALPNLPTTAPLNTDASGALGAEPQPSPEGITAGAPLTQTVLLTQPPAPVAPPTPTAMPTPVATLTTPAPVAPLQQGGSWDMEAGFYSWPSPYENFGGFTANGWDWFINAYAPDADPPNAPRLNENQNPANVYRGQRSQEISFDYRHGEAGIWRTLAVTPNHRYLIEAWARYAPSPGGVQLYLGVDLAGGTNFKAATVAWYPWRDMTPDWWIATQETVIATGDTMTIFLRAVHPVAEPGGNTMFDTVSVTDRGP